VVESYPEPGFNYRMTDMAAALGLCQLELLDEILERRRRLAKRYTEAIGQMPYVEAPHDPPYATRTWQAYCASLREGSPVRRADLLQRLLDDGIAAKGGVMAIHNQPAYAGSAADLPFTEVAARDSFMLPLFPSMTDEQQEYVISRLAAHVSALAVGLAAGPEAAARVAPAA
jgi:perosamine synthetase